MPATSPLPTIATVQLTQLSLRASLEDIPNLGKDSQELRLFYYAVTQAGWSILRTPIRQWHKISRKAPVAFIGTDHGITSPQALKKMQDDGVDVRLLTRYAGVYHPKVVWLSGRKSQLLWVGSNNLTDDGLSSNIELAVLLESPTAHPDLVAWANAIEASSEPLTQELLSSYEKERKKFASSQKGVFTWSRREKQPRPATRPSAPVPSPAPTGTGSANADLGLPHTPRSGDLVIEIMPRETGTGGSQIQLPTAAVSPFFGLNSAVGSTLPITLRSSASGESKALTMTVYDNHTVRLSISELDYTHRPCLIHFYRNQGGRFSFQIIQRAVYPQAYRHLLRLCAQTRAGSRRWTLLP